MYQLNLASVESRPELAAAQLPRSSSEADLDCSQLSRYRPDEGKHGWQVKRELFPFGRVTKQAHVPALETSLLRFLVAR